MNWSMVVQRQQYPRYLNYLEDYQPCAGGLSAVNAIGTQLRPDKLGTEPMAYNMAVEIVRRRCGNREESRDE